MKKTATGNSRPMTSQSIGRTLTAQASAKAQAPAPAQPAASAAASAADLLESAPVAIYRTDAAGNMTYSNPEYRRIFGLKPGHSPDAWARCVHPDDRARMEQAWAEFCLEPAPSRFAYRTQADDGAICHFSEQVVSDDAGGGAGTITRS